MFVYDALKFSCSSIEDCSVADTDAILEGPIKKAKESYAKVKKDQEEPVSMSKSVRKQLAKNEREAIKFSMDASLKSMIHIPKVLSVYQDSLSHFFGSGKIFTDEMKAYCDTFLKEVKEFEEANVESKDSNKKMITKQKQTVITNTLVCVCCLKCIHLFYVWTCISFRFYFLFLTHSFIFIHVF